MRPLLTILTFAVLLGQHGNAFATRKGEIMNVSWTSIAVGVADLDEALALWRDSFGLAVVDSRDGGDPELARLWQLQPGDIACQALLATDDQTTGLTYAQGDQYLSVAGRFVSGRSAIEFRSSSVPDYSSERVTNYYLALDRYIWKALPKRVQLVKWRNSTGKNRFHNYDWYASAPWLDLSRPEDDQFIYDHPGGAAEQL